MIALLDRCLRISGPKWLASTVKKGTIGIQESMTFADTKGAVKLLRKFHKRTYGKKEYVDFYRCGRKLVAVNYYSTVKPAASVLHEHISLPWHCALVLGHSLVIFDAASYDRGTQEGITAFAFTAKVRVGIL